MPTAAQPLIDTLSGDMPDLLRPIKVQKRCASAGPILQVKSGSVTVPVYRCGDGRLPRFFIAYYRNGQRVRQSFSTIDEAKREAQVAARQIAAGLAKATGLSIAEREAYDAAKAILEAAGIPLLSAVEEYAQCRKILEGKSLLAAVSDYAQRNKGVRIGAKLPDLIEEFLAAKKQDGASDRYLYQLKSDVKRFAEAFPLPILHIKSHQIDEWLRKLGGAPRTRNTVHTSIRTFFSWAKARSYLPKNEATEAEAVSKVKVGDTETGIFTPAQIKSLLAIATPEMIPFIAIGAFAGLRAAEIARLDWRWQKLKITLDPTGRITAAYGKQRQSHTFTKANKTGICRHIEILATMAVHGAWQPSSIHSAADKKAFKRLQAELEAILPLPGDPFRKEGAQFHSLFQLTLPKEHWRDTSEENELGSEED